MSNPFAFLASKDFLSSLLAGIVPRGGAWSRDPSSVQVAFWSALADLQAYFHAQAAVFSETESNPATAVLLLPDWERAFGLPDPCTPQPQSLAQRQMAVVARKTDAGGQSIPHFIAVAAALGFTITITEFVPASCLSRCTDFLYGTPWRFAFQVNAALNTIITLTCLGVCTDPLRSWGNTELECVIDARKRGSRIALFAYS